MAIIKRNSSGKIITKSDKVSCGCCFGGCLMYSSTQLRLGVYSIDDLPQTITFQASSEMERFTLELKNPPMETYPGSGDFSVYYAVPGGDRQYIFGPVIDYLWGFSGSLAFPYTYNGELLLATDQLIPSATDMFANSYTVTACSYPPVIGATLTRKALCNWQGTYTDPISGPQLAQIFYCANEEFNPFDYPGQFVQRNDYSGCQQFDDGPSANFYAAVGSSASRLVATKTPHFNTPAGNYAGDMTITFA
jgi:hypothetical protein